eukprot:3268158-Rhodomonas_salina.2
MQCETEPITLQIDRFYKADLTFKTLPIDSYYLILGSPWLTDNKAVPDHWIKTVMLPHCSKTVVLHPQNPVRPLSEQDLALRSLALDSPDGSTLYADEGVAVVRSVQPTSKLHINPSDGPAKQWPFKLKTLKHITWWSTHRIRRCYEEPCCAAQPQLQRVLDRQVQDDGCKALRTGY